MNNQLFMNCFTFIICWVFTSVAIAQCSYTASVNATPAICYGSSTGTASVTITGSSGPYQIAWNTNPPQSGNAISNVPAGSYSVIITDTSNCIVNYSFAIQQPNPLTVNLGADTLICPNSSFRKGVVTSGGTPPYSYNWACNQPGCGVSTPTAMSPLLTPSMPTLYTLQVTDNNGCSASDFFIVQYIDQEKVTAGDDQTLYIGESTSLTAATGTNAGTFSWAPTIGLDNPNSPTPTANPTNPTSYIVYYTSPQGCVSSDTTYIDIDFSELIPTGLTPNGDGINDVWDIKGFINYPNLQVEVFDRLGDRVFEGNAIKHSWDGSYNNMPLPAGTYFFVIRPNNGADHAITGSLTLIR